MNYLRKLFIETCKNYKNIRDTSEDYINMIDMYTDLDRMDCDVWDTQMGEAIENSLIITMKFIYKLYYPKNKCLDFVNSVLDLIYDNAVILYADGEKEVIKTFEDLYEFWFGTTTTMTTIANIL